MTSDPVEMRHCDGCGEDYDAFEESHIAHNDHGTYETALVVSSRQRWVDGSKVGPLLGEVGYWPRHDPPHLDLARVAEVVLGLGVTPDADCDLCKGRETACPKHAGEAIATAVSAISCRCNAEGLPFPQQHASGCPKYVEAKR